MAVGTQFKTSNIVLNETLMGFEDNFELLDRVNTDYEEMVAQAMGMPTGGAISVRTQGYKQPQTGQTFTISPIVQEFETILVDTDQMLGDLVSVGSTEFQVDRNRITDLSHYQFSQSLATAVNISCYQELALNCPYFVGSATSNTVDFTLVSALQTFAREMSIPFADETLFMNTKDYNSMIENVRTDNIFANTGDLNESANRYMTRSWAGIPIVQSQSLITLRHISGTASGDTLTFGGLVSTDSYKSAVITIDSDADGTLLAGDRILFTVTKVVNPISKRETRQYLQLIVQEDVTSVGQVYSNVPVVGGILATSDTANGGEWFGNVLAVPTVGEPISVLTDHDLNFYTTRPGFTFATVGLQDISTLRIADWAKSGTNKLSLAQSRNPDQPNTPINIRTIFDAEITTASQLMRIDMQPVYKAFLRYNIALITQAT